MKPYSVDKSTVNAMAAFRLGRQFYERMEFTLASRFIAEYYSRVDYDTFDKNDRRPINSSPLWSVIIVSYRSGRALLDCLDSVFQQRCKEFEVILVDNGDNDSIGVDLLKYPLLHIAPPGNLLPSEGRNVGARAARGRYLAFIDDDGLLLDDYLEEGEAALHQYSVLAARGRIVPKSLSGITASHYDLGSNSMESKLTLEGNMVINRNVFLKVGGFDALMFGHEGNELGKRIDQHFPGSRKIYWPRLVLKHDFAVSARLDEKKKRQSIGINYIKYKTVGYNLSVIDKSYNEISESVSIVVKAGLIDEDVLHFLDCIPFASLEFSFEVLVIADSVNEQEVALLAKYCRYFPVVCILNSGLIGSRSIVQRLKYGSNILFFSAFDIDGHLCKILFSRLRAIIQSPGDFLYNCKKYGLKGLGAYYNYDECESIHKDCQNFDSSNCENLGFSEDYRTLMLSNDQYDRPPVEGRIVGGMATIPSRLDTLPYVLENLKSQLDHIYVYLNGHEEIPVCVIDPQITYGWSKWSGDLKAAGKFYFVGDIEYEYYFSLDDDVVYPRDYVYQMVKASCKYKNKLPITVHGSIFGNPLEWYLERTEVFGMLHGSEFDRFVNLCGTATLLFHNSVFENLSVDNFLPEPMCDLQISILARQKGLPIVSIKRSRGWLSVIDNDQNKAEGNDYWNVMLLDDGKRTELAKSVDWCYSTYREFVEKYLLSHFSGVDDVCLKRHSFDYDFISSMNVDECTPDCWNYSESKLFHLRKYQYLRKKLKFREVQARGLNNIREVFESKSDVLYVPKNSTVSDLKSKIEELRVNLYS